nr:MAG TPA: hypothetical protein [Bacteriophage sp.]
MISICYYNSVVKNIQDNLKGGRNMRVVRTNIESKVEQFKAVKNAHAVKDLPDGFELTQNFINYIDEKQDGKEVEILAVQGSDEEYYGTNSTTFIHDYLEIIDMFDDCEEDFTIVKDSNVSKAGRQFVFAKLA